MANNPNFKKNVGRLSTDRYDFENHLQGVNPSSPSHYVASFRHKASQIDIDDPSAVYGGSTNVEDAIENLKFLSDIIVSAGQGFITVGDGYDTWANANGTINYDSRIPSLDTLLNPIFSAISAGSGIPDEFKRIKGGGIVLIKAGTYTIANTINVPPGIVIIGEGYGTKLVNITSLTIPSYGIEPSPKVSPTPVPLFKILSDGSRSGNDAAIDPSLFMFSRATKFINLTICDNFVEPPVLGAIYYKASQNNTGNTPLILQLDGSNLELHNVYLMGRVSFSSGTIVSGATRFAIQLDATTSPIGTGSNLKLDNCFIDGFSQPIQFRSIGGILDILEVSNCKIRSHGYLDGDNSAATSNCLFNVNDNNTLISNNVLYGNHANCKNIVFLNSQLGSAPNIQSKSKITISNNEFIINRGSNTNVSGVNLSINSAILATHSTRVNIAISGNIDNLYKIDSALGLKTLLANTNYTVDTNGPDLVIFIDSTTAAPFTIFLPKASNADGRTLIIKDQGQATTNNITLTRNNGSEKIEGLTSDYIIDTNFQVVKLISLSGNWWIL